MLLNSHISAYTMCLAGKVCGLVWSTWGTSQGEDKLGARDKRLNTKVAHRACSAQTFPPGHMYTWRLCTAEFFKRGLCKGVLCTIGLCTQVDCMHGDCVLPRPDLLK